MSIHLTHGQNVWYCIYSCPRNNTFPKQSKIIGFSLLIPEISAGKDAVLSVDTRQPDWEMAASQRLSPGWLHKPVDWLLIVCQELSVIWEGGSLGYLQCRKFWYLTHMNLHEIIRWIPTEYSSGEVIKQRSSHIMLSQSCHQT